MSKSDYNQSLLASSKKPLTAADKIPIIARGAVSERATDTLNVVRDAFQDFTRVKADAFRSRNLSKRNASPLMLYSPPNWAKARRDGLLIRR